MQMIHALTSLPATMLKCGKNIIIVSELFGIQPKGQKLNKSPSDSPRKPELPTLNASSTSIPNRERRYGVIEDTKGLHINIYLS